MSHARSIKDHESGDLIQFQFNSDFSGYIEVSRTHGDNVSFVNVPGHILLTFVAEWVAMQRISELELADWKTVFGIKGR